MTSAELTALRLSLGLSNPQAARMLGVLPRSVLRWERGERAVPEFAADCLTHLDADVDALAAAVSNQFLKLRDGNRVVLTAYETEEQQERYAIIVAYPATTHLMMLHRVKRLLAAAGVEARIEYFKG